MPQEIKETFIDMWIYICKTIVFTKPLWAILTTIFSYVLFPDASYIPAAIALMCALALDIITKYYSISVVNGGLRNALKLKKLSSESLWRGTKKKLISVLIVMILCGLSYRVSFIPSVSIALTAFAYSLMFWREAQSCIENLLDAGHEDLRWFLIKIQRKQKEIEKEDENSDSSH